MVHRVVHHPVPHRRFMNHPMLGIENMKAMIRTVMVCNGNEVIVQSKDIIFKMAFKNLYIGTLTLSPAELSPGRKKCRHLNHFIKKHVRHTRIPCFQNSLRDVGCV